MALPMMSAPTYNMVVPSSGLSVKYRPFLVKEEKALLVAQQSEDIRVMVDTLKGVIKTCVLDEIDADKLATFDLEYMFTQIRAKSVGEIVELIFPCDVDHGEQNEKARVKISIDLTTIQVEKNENHNAKVELFNDVGVVMKYPTVDDMKKLDGMNENDLDAVFKVVAGAIDYIYTGDEVFHAKEQKQEDLLNFLYNLTSEQFMKIQGFFDTMPKLKKEVEYDCPVCGLHHKKSLEGLQSFF
jgi:rubrerythrin